MLVACGGATASRSTEDASADAPTVLPDGTAGGADADAGGANDDATSCSFCLDAATDVHLSLCPSSPPAAGSACTLPDGEECEYGPSWWLGCNLVLRCQAGTWQVYGGGTCIEPDAGGGGTCPSSWIEASALDDGGGGVGPCPASDCQYPEGYCECLSGCGGGGAPHPMVLMGRWYCAAATTACPSPRPDLGTPCSTDAGCQYGQPCGCGQELQCVDGVWQGYPIPPCP